MRARNPNVTRATRIIEGAATPRRAGGRLTLVDTSGNEAHPVSQILFEGAQVTESDGETAIVTIGQTNQFVPNATVTATKNSGNPTFAFDAVPENVVKVGSTYYCPYMDNTDVTAVFKLATATSRDGPWTAGSTIYQASNVPWIPSPGVGTGIYAPFIIESSSTFYLFYSAVISGGGTSAYNAIGVATATAITGTYTDHGAAIFSPSAAGLWDSRRVGEPAVIYQAGQWVMAYMGEDSDLTYSTSEKVGIATASVPTGPWTRAAGNPVIDFGASGAWDDALVADPHLFYADGYYWIWYAGGSDSNPTTAANEGLAYATSAGGPYTRYTGNPILSVGASGAWDDVWVFRGGLYLEGGTWSGVYAGYSGTAYRGGNFTLSVISGSTGDTLQTAAQTSIADAGGYYTGTEVETALQEIGADFTSLDLGGGGHWEVVIDGTAPPVAVTNEAEDDWIYGFVPD